MKKRKFGQAALDAIDREIEYSIGLPQKVAELRAIRRVIVAAGKAKCNSLVKPIEIILSYRSNKAIAKAILNAREVEARRKRNA